MFKYCARINWRWGCDAEIREVEVDEKETESSVWIKGRRNAKKSEYNNYYDTWEDAHTALCTQQKYNVKRLRDRLEHAEKRLAEIEAMEE